MRSDDVRLAVTPKGGGGATAKGGAVRCRPPGGPDDRSEVAAAMYRADRASSTGPRPIDQLLDLTANQVAARAAYLYRVTDAGLEETASVRPLEGTEHSAREAASRALRSGDPHHVPAGDGHLSLAIPCSLDGEPVAVLVVELPSFTGGVVDRAVARIGTVLPLALATDHERAQSELVAERDHAVSLKNQLEAYAVDLRTTYEAEQERTVELARALDELAETYRATVRGLAIAVEAKDESTGDHLHRVTRYGLAVTAMAAPDHLHDPQFEYGFLLHDVGKLTVPDAILTKPGKLTPEEWLEIQKHPEEGRNILESIPFLAGAREIVFAHHERWDGAGYPRRLRADEIPLGARIFPLADAFDAMTSRRPYRPAMPVEEALAELQRGSGSQFWPDAVDAFVSIDRDLFDEVRAQFPDRPGT